MRRRLLYLSLLLVVFVAFLDIFFGLNRGFFWTYWEWSVLIHVLAGCAVGLFAAWVRAVMGKKPDFFFPVLLALAVGGAWEIFEYFTGTGYSVFMSYPLETTKDIVDDCVGGAVAGYFVIAGWL